MVNVNCDSESVGLSHGWDPYEVWYVRVRCVTHQLTQQNDGSRAGGKWTRSMRALGRLLRTTPFLSV